MEIIKTPTTLSVITTYKCSSTCPNCCFQCSPKRHEFLSKDDIIKYIHKSITEFPSIKVLVLTGGECTLLKNDLLEIISFATKKIQFNC